MKVILIEEARFTEVCDLMEQAVIKSAQYSQYKPEGLSQEHWEHALKEAHAAIHYTFVRWAQSHGASCTYR